MSSRANRDKDPLEVHFTLGTYLVDKAAVIALALAVTALICLVLYVIGISKDCVLLVLIVQASVLVVALAIEYLRRKRFWRQVENAITSLTQASHFQGLADEASFLDGALAFQATSKIADCAKSELLDLKEQNREHSTYTELWVHEVKTPLAAAKLLVNKMHGADAVTLKKELERIELLVEQALYTARLTSLQNDYLIREISLTEAINEACKQNMQSLTARAIKLDIQIDPGEQVFADKAYLIFMIGQIISNAAKYDARTISFCATSSPEEGSHACTVLKIADDGCGIPASDVPRVFDRGFTGEVGRSHGSATGMGLYLVASMCAQLGLDIMLASEQGSGTRVEITFPHDRRRALLTTS